MRFTPRYMGKSIFGSDARRVLVWVLLAGLCIQLIAFTRHHHDLVSHTDDCVACELVALTSGGSAPPAAAPEIIAPVSRVFSLAVQRATAALPGSRFFIRPAPHAPPAI